MLFAPMTGSKLRSDWAVPRRVVLTWLAGLAIGLLVTAASGEGMRHALFDWWQRIAPRNLEKTDVRVVLIDNDSVTTLGAWPWPRYHMARLTEEMAARRARIIAYDILFSEPDRVGPDAFVSLYPELSGPAAEQVRALPSMDALFGEVIGQAPVILAHAGVNEPTEPPPGLDTSLLEGRAPRQLDQWPGELAAIPELEMVALGNGLVNARPDRDGVTRSVPLVLNAAGALRPGFALETARQATGAEVVRLTPRSATVGDRKVPIDQFGWMRLHFGQFPAKYIYSADQILGRSPEIPADALDGKIIVVGMSADGTSDIAATPSKAEEFGPLIQAQAIDTLLRGGWLERPSWGPSLEWILAASLAILALGVAVFNRAYRYALAGAFLVLPVGAWVAFAEGSLLLDPARPLVVGAAALGGAALGLFSIARAERERLRERLVEERVAAAETAGELEAARSIQLGMVPPREKLERIDPRVDLSAILEPAKSVGGDFYDAVLIDPDTLAIAVADVTGKGVPAALFMAMSKALTGAALSQPDADPSKIMSVINDQLLRDHGESMSVTMVLAILDLRSGLVRLACAGHEDPIVINSAGSLDRVRLEGGPPLSILPYEYPREEIQLQQGDTLLLITDGVTEAQDRHGALFGVTRLLAEGTGQGNAREICEIVSRQVRAFEDGTEATDDLTVMAARYLGVAN